MERPDVTPVQKLVAAASVVVTTGLALLTTFGLLSPTEAAAVAGFAGSVGSALVVADAVIRNGRSRALANPDAVRELEQPAKPITWGDGSA